MNSYPRTTLEALGFEQLKVGNSSKRRCSHGACAQQAASGLCILSSVVLFFVLSSWSSDFRVQMGDSSVWPGLSHFRVTGLCSKRDVNGHPKPMI